MRNAISLLCLCVLPYLLGGCAGTSRMLAPGSGDQPARPPQALRQAVFIPTMQGRLLHVDLTPYLRVAGTPEQPAYTWQWGDGQHETVFRPTATHVYERPGRYAVQVTVHDGVTQRDQLAMTIELTGSARITRINPVDQAMMVWVPAGSALLGSRPEEITSLNARFHTAYFACEGPAHQVTTGCFFVYRNEVTVKQYRQFCMATGHAWPAEAPAWGWDDESPMVLVNWHDAAAYAAWASGRLPTEAEWERVARGDVGVRYPWGNTWDASACANWTNCTNGQLLLGPSRVNAFPDGATTFGANDMSGNVWEWCADWFDPGYYQHAPARNPGGPETGTARVIRGGGWTTSVPEQFRCAHRWEHPPLSGSEDIGFRCVVDAAPPVWE